MAAIIARELGVPCVVGTSNATKVLGEKQLVTVDGFQGRVYQGRVASDTRIEAPAVIRKHLKTATKVYVNLAEPDLASAVAARDVDGVGLLRAEFILPVLASTPATCSNRTEAANLWTNWLRASAYSPKLSIPDQLSIEPPTSRPTNTAISRGGELRGSGRESHAWLQRMFTLHQRARRL